MSMANFSEIKAAFKYADYSREGTITTKDLAIPMRALGVYPSAAELQEIIREVDVDGSGRIGFKEFLPMMAKRMQNQDSEEEILEAFRVFDRDGNGFISLADLRHIMKNLGGEDLTTGEINDLISEAVVDDDGMINYEDVVKRMLST